MRYLWDDGSVTVGGDRVAGTVEDFWGRAPAVEIDGEAWVFRVQRDGMTGSRTGDDGDAIVLERTIDVHIRALRKKMGRYADLVQTVRGIGYRLRDPADVVSM